MRCYAYQLPREVYHDLEGQILQQLREGDRAQLGYLLTEHDLAVELLSGEWRVLFAALSDYYQHVDPRHRVARMVVSPSELAEFVTFLRDPQRRDLWRPITFGLAELSDALPVGVDLVGLVFVEESDDWLWSEPVSELVAMRPEVYALLEPHLRAALAIGDYPALARMAEDHAESCVEFSREQWKTLLRHTEERVPELLSVYAARLSTPTDYTSILEALAQVADPRYQPSLDAWLRVHSRDAQYALYFRDGTNERREFEASGLLRLPGLQSGRTEPQQVIPGGTLQAPPLMRPGVPEPQADVPTDPHLRLPSDGGRVTQRTVPLSSEQIAEAIRRGERGE